MNGFYAPPGSAQWFQCLGALNGSNAQALPDALRAAMLQMAGRLHGAPRPAPPRPAPPRPAQRRGGSRASGGGAAAGAELDAWDRKDTPFENLPYSRPLHWSPAPAPPRQLPRAARRGCVERPSFVRAKASAPLVRSTAGAAGAGADGPPQREASCDRRVG